MAQWQWHILYVWLLCVNSCYFFGLTCMRSKIIGFWCTGNIAELQSWFLTSSVDEKVKILFHFFFAERKQCILVCHDWGSIVGSAFVEKYTDMVQKYVLMGAPPRKVFKKLLRSSWDQFKRSWYIFFFQCPILPELVLTCEDLVAFDKMLGRRHNDELTDEFLEAYKYVFSKPG